MATTTVPAPEAHATLSPFARILGVFFSPKSTFEDIVRNPTWILPAVILTVVSAVAAIGINQRMDWRQFIGEQIEKSSRAGQLSAEQKQQQVEVAAKFAPISTFVFGIPAPLAVIAIVALAMMVAYNLLAGVNINYLTSLGIVAHASVITILNSMIFLIVLFLRPVGTLDLQNPVASNAAVVLPAGSAMWLITLLKSIDIFTIWNLILLAIGFAAANPKKLRGAKSFTIVACVWAAFVIVRVGIAFIFS